MSETECRAWDQQEGEPNRWFNRFERYRLLGPSRSILAAVNQERVAKSKKESPQSPGSWRNAAKAWNWRDRAEAWDRFKMAEAAAEIEAKWQAEIMNATEVLGRLSQIGRVNINDFVVLGSNGHIVGFKKDNLEKFGYLVKKITSSEGKTDSVGIELYSAQEALGLLGKHHGLFADRNLNLDLSNLTNEQLQRIANGEDPILVAATGGSPADPEKPVE